MKKRLVLPFDDGKSLATPTENWLNLESLAELEITSEDPEHPIDGAIDADSNEPGWRAANPGEQLIRVCFTKPQNVKRIRLIFEEKSDQRSQEFVLRWSPTGTGDDYREIVRQQYNFSPPGTTQETEDYAVNLEAVKTLELSIVPDISGGGLASLAKLQVA